jgi:hypothetical protein
MKLPITIEYNDGEVATYYAAPPEWAKWEKSTGKVVSKLDDGVGMYDLLFLAYHAHKRELAGKPIKSFEVWMETVADVTAGENDPKATNAEV